MKKKTQLQQHRKYVQIQILKNKNQGVFLMKVIIVLKQIWIAVVQLYTPCFFSIYMYCDQTFLKIFFVCLCIAGKKLATITQEIQSNLNLEKQKIRGFFDENHHCFRIDMDCYKPHVFFDIL
eukprot:TRINITY_DN3513_c0_g2_i1.p3 TRINITY_DN3513_c0_g2~~TRINITY_DN3513_c0_g2_i1.p3  ORF type:complete len:122 (-),score=2.64 TRINITY_DN3513_c0_g2_i1:617-982(-)